MALLAGKTCGDCQHFARCSELFGHIAADEVCDFAPSRFVLAKTPARRENRGPSHA